MPPKGTTSAKGKGKEKATAESSNELSSKRGSRPAAKAGKAARKRAGQDSEDDGESSTPVPANKKAKPKAPAARAKRARAQSTVSDLQGDESSQLPPKKQKSKVGKPKKKAEKAEVEDAQPLVPYVDIDMFKKMLPPELRLHTYFDMIQGSGSTRTYFDDMRQMDLVHSMDSTSLVMSDKSNMPVPAKFVETFNDDRFKNLRKNQLANHDRRFNEFFCNISDRIWFEFNAAADLQTFAAQLVPWLHHIKNLKTTLSIRLHIFEREKKWDALAEYKRGLELPHGYKEKAEDEFGDWMDGLLDIQKAGKKCHIETTVELAFYQPWRDYISIRAQCAQIFGEPDCEATGSFMRLSKVHVDTRAWQKIMLSGINGEAEDLIVYYALLASAVFDKKLPEEQRQVIDNFDSLERLCDYGCTGMRFSFADTK